jgi:hypothetical protein
MAEVGLVATGKDASDGRKRLLALTAKAIALLPSLKRVWNELAKAQIAAFREEGCDIISVLNRVEDRLDRTSIATVVLKRLATIHEPAKAPSRRTHLSPKSPSRERIETP